MIQPLGIELPSFHFKTGSLGNLNLTTLVLESIDVKQVCNQSIPNITSKSKISSSTKSTNVTLLENNMGQILKTLVAITESATGVVTKRVQLRHHVPHQASSPLKESQKIRWNRDLVKHIR